MMNALLLCAAFVFADETPKPVAEPTAAAEAAKGEMSACQKIDAAIRALKGSDPKTRKKFMELRKKRAVAKCAGESPAPRK